MWIEFGSIVPQTPHLTPVAEFTSQLIALVSGVMQSLEGFCEMVVLGKHCLLKGCQLNCEGLIVIVVLHTYGKYFFHMFRMLKKKKKRALL